MDRKKKAWIWYVVGGIVILMIPLFCRYRQESNTGLYVNAFEEEQHEKTDKKKDSLLSREGVIGIIEIPDLNLKLPIFEGDGNEQLNKGIGHLSDSAALGSQGNCVLAGHNGSRHGIFFTYLSNIEIGAKVKLTTLYGEYTYEVYEMRVVSPYEEWVTEETEEEIVTLFTCAEHGTKRFVAKCRRLAE